MVKTRTKTMKENLKSETNLYKHAFPDRLFPLSLSIASVNRVNGVTMQMLHHFHFRSDNSKWNSESKIEILNQFHIINDFLIII